MERVNLKQSEDSYDQPFREPLSDSDLAYTIKRLSSNPDKLVREWDLEQYGQSVEDARKGIEMFRKMERLYGIAVTKMDLLIGKSHGRVKLFTIVDKIEGANLAYGVKELPQSAREEVDMFFANLAQFYFDILKRGGEYWWDYGTHQLVYGHKKGESENRVYIVDVEPRYYVYEENHDNGNVIAPYLNEIAEDVLSLESVFKNGELLQKTRTSLLKMADEILKNDPNNSHAKQIKILLIIKSK